MAAYEIRIYCRGCFVRLWPDLADYDGLVKKRFDAVKLALRKAIYEAMQGLSLLDRSVATELDNWAKNLTKPRHGFLVESGNRSSDFTFHVVRKA